MVRSAYFFGVHGVLASSKNCARLSAAACKASAGSLEEVDLYDTNNLASCLQDAADKGWQVQLLVLLE
jgi:21S rRNA (GM2251-2'-O)-methyltransferase